jgi:hypothetical protein
LRGLFEPVPYKKIVNKDSHPAAGEQHDGDDYLQDQVDGLVLEKVIYAP